ncbi:MAG: hypothetical protein HUJ90_01500, partial [Bacteroidales bacterium]|nr:hypothetical protein [Bacteroidales bacterium]
MKKFIISMVFAVSSIMLSAQNFTPMMQQGPSEDLYSALFKDVNYAGDNLEAHNLDIYLPKNSNGKPKMVILIYGSAWFMNNMK